MGKLTRNEELAEYFLRAAGVAAVWIDAEGHVGARDVATIKIEDDHLVYCCARGVHFTLAYRLYEWKMGIEPNIQKAGSSCASDTQRALALKLEQLAELGGVGLTPHTIAIQRAFDMVKRVDDKFERLRTNGGLKELNANFKAARAEDPSLRYADFILARKAAAIEALALGPGSIGGVAAHHAEQ